MVLIVINREDKKQKKFKKFSKINLFMYLCLNFLVLSNIICDAYDFFYKSERRYIGIMHETLRMTDGEIKHIKKIDY